VAGLPVCEALGGKSRDRIRVYNTCGSYKYIATNAAGRG